MILRRNTCIAFAATLSTILVTRAHAQEQFAPIDSAIRTFVQRAIAVDAQLAAPEIQPTKIELPPTVVPADVLDLAQRKASDLNRDGIVDQTDAALLTSKIGRCPAGSVCTADLNGDGEVSDLDSAILQRNLGTMLDTNVAHAERVGNVAAAPPALLPAMPNMPRGDGSRVMRLELRSQGARGLRLKFSDLNRSSGLELRFHDPVKGTVLGPYTSPSRLPDGTWWSPTIFGDTIGVEMTLRAGGRLDNRLPAITEVCYLFCDGVDCSFAPSATLPCHNDVTCTPSWATADARGIAVIYFVTGGGCSRCSGALLNRGPGDFSPLFATANHCISTQAEADSVDFVWFFETASCDGSPPVDGMHNLGSLLLKHHPASDETLLGLYEQPATDFYIGSNAGAWASGDAATGVHHPRGAFKRISFGTSAGSEEDAPFCDPTGPISCTCTGGQCIEVDVWLVNYSSGTAEPGSSGSPIFDSSRRMRGVLTGGTESCPTVTKKYGRFDRAYTYMRYFLDNTDVPAADVYVNKGVPGDPGNAGTSERGLIGDPFNTVREGTFCVRAGTNLHIMPGNYDEKMTIWRPMTLSRTGLSGTVRIGAP